MLANNRAISGGNGGKTYQVYKASDELPDEQCFLAEVRDFPEFNKLLYEQALHVKEVWVNDPIDQRWAEAWLADYQKMLKSL